MPAAPAPRRTPEMGGSLARVFGARGETGLAALAGFAPASAGALAAAGAFVALPAGAAIVVDPRPHVVPRAPQVRHNHRLSRWSVPGLFERVKNGGNLRMSHPPPMVESAR